MTHSLVFVYGTLKRGQANHHFLADARFVGEAVTATADYAMTCNGSFPSASDRPGGSRIAGELYAVDRRTLRNLDRLEGHPRFYRRRLRLFTTAAGSYRAWIYVAPARPGRSLASPPISWEGDYL